MKQPKITSFVKVIKSTSQNNTNNSIKLVSAFLAAPTGENFAAILHNVDDVCTEFDLKYDSVPKLPDLSDNVKPLTVKLDALKTMSSTAEGREMVDLIT